MTGIELTVEQKDRAAGVLVGLAIGDALGVPYEFRRPPLPEYETPAMIGGGLGPYEPGEYSDDTQMAVCIANVASTGADLRDDLVLANIGDAFVGWSRRGATDIGSLTRKVLERAFVMSGTPGMNCAVSATYYYRRDRSSFGNGALMRTAPVALFALGGRDGGDGRRETAAAARRIACLTHADPRAGDGCVLWCEAIRVAVFDGRCDLAGGLDLLPEERDPEGDDDQPANPRAYWAEIVEESGRTDWRDLVGQTNGSTKNSLRVAWSAITSTLAGAKNGTDHTRRALEAAVHVGHDTDTTAAIAGSLLGAAYGAGAMPEGWRTRVHGWSGLDISFDSPRAHGLPGFDKAPDYRASDLARLGLLIALGGTAAPDDQAVWQVLGESGLDAEGV